MSDDIVETLFGWIINLFGKILGAIASLIGKLLLLIVEGIGKLFKNLFSRNSESDEEA